MRGLILDLRFNPGGLLSSAIEVSNLFISSGRIVSTKGRNTPERVWNARSNGAFEGFPMVVLVNHYSASASEIVSACLQDHQRAVVMGERTWGKGSVQNVIELDDGRSALEADHRRLLPSQRQEHPSLSRLEGQRRQWGVMPDAGYDLRLSDHEKGLLLVPIASSGTFCVPIRRRQHATGPGGQPPKDDTTMLPAPSPCRPRRPRAARSASRAKSPRRPTAADRPREIAGQPAAPERRRGEVRRPPSSIASCRWPSSI